MARHETRGGVFSRSDTFAKMIEHLRLAAEASYMIGHHMKEDGDNMRGQGFLAIGQMLEEVVKSATKLAIKRMSQ